MSTKVVSTLDLSGNRIENLADPTADQDAATRAWVLAQILAGGGYTDEDARDAIAAALVAGNNIDITVNDAGDTITIDVEALTSGDITDFAAAAVAAANAGVIDADTLGGSTKAQVISDAIAGVVDTAPATLDTLNELAAALGDDPNFAASVNTALAARTQKFTTTVGDGAATSIAVTHNLNTRAVVVEVYDSTTFDTVIVDVVRTSTNVVTLGFADAPAAGAYTVVVVG